MSLGSLVAVNSPLRFEPPAFRDVRNWDVLSVPEALLGVFSNLVALFFTKNVSPRYLLSLDSGF
jgi:hypothetical protein